ncbi:MAG: hypothetical protein RI909_404 [Bacteroidota bacterium]
MLTRFGYPVLFSVAGILFFLLPLAPSNHVAEKTLGEIYTGSNTFSCQVNDVVFDKNTFAQAEVVHTADLFYLTLWVGEGRENRITFVLNDEEIKEAAYELDHPSKKYLSFLFHGQDCAFASDDYYTGMLMIHHYDTAHKIIAGSFEFMAFSDECNELVRVTDGKFDARY